MYDLRLVCGQLVSTRRKILPIDPHLLSWPIRVGYPMAQQWLFVVPVKDVELIKQGELGPLCRLQSGLYV